MDARLAGSSPVPPRIRDCGWALGNWRFHFHRGQRRGLPTPTVSQVQGTVNKLNSQFDKVSEQLDQTTSQLTAAQSKLKQVQKRGSDWARSQYQVAQDNVAALAAAAFEDASSMSVAGVLTSNNPATVLQQGSLLLQLSGTRNAETNQLLTDATQLVSVQQVLQRTENGIQGLQTQLTAHKTSLGKLIQKQKATLDSLTISQQQTVENNTVGGGGTTAPVTTHVTDPLPLSGSVANKVVSFEFAAIGCPYVWGFPVHATWDSTAPACRMPRMPPRVWTSLATHTNSGPRSAAYRSRRCSRATCCTTTVRVT